MVTRRTIRDNGNHRNITIIEEDEPVVVADTHSGEEDVVTAYPDGYEVANGFVRTLNRFIALFLLIGEALLVFRLIFALRGANPQNNFVDFIYDVTGPLVAPFEGIFSESASGDGVFEPQTVIAMAAYALAAFIIIAFLSIVVSAPRTTAERRVVTHQRHAHTEEM